MHRPASPVAAVLPYAVHTARRRFTVYALGVMTPLVLYAVVYILLRLFGVYYPFYNQGSWDNIDGSTHLYIVDVAFLPARVIECDLLNRCHWIKEPSGG